MIGKTNQLTSPTKSVPDHGAERLHLHLRQLEVFVAIARGGSTRAAADRVARSQSAASAALAELEGVLGVRLFDRVGRRLVLNENGRALIGPANALLDQAHGVERLFTQHHAAPLKVAASMTIGEYILPTLLAQWQKNYPSSSIQLVITNTAQVLDAVAEFKADLGFIEGPQSHPDLVVQPWLHDDMVIVASPRHPLAHRKPSTKLLREALWVVRESGSGTRETADRWLIENLGSVHVAFELSSSEAIKRLVAQSEMLACLSRYAVMQALAEGSLVELRTHWPAATRRLAMVLHRDKHLGQSSADFVAYCRDSAGPWQDQSQHTQK